jgi:hypothetical protein
MKGCPVRVRTSALRACAYRGWSRSPPG